jgi:hypothetical protein
MTLAALVTAAGCASYTAPPGYLPTASAAPFDIHGGWIDVLTRTPDGPERVSGELIAVTADSIWVLSPDGTRVVPTAAIRSGELVGWDGQAGTVGAATVIGTLSTISNGYYLVFTAPTWVLVGTVAAINQSNLPIQELPVADWSALRPFARFPQGLPPGIDLDGLQSKTGVRQGRLRQP